MTKIRTSEDIRQMLEQRKLQREKSKQAKSKQYQKQYQKQYRSMLKQSEREDLERVKQNIIKFVESAPLPSEFETIEQVYTYGNSLIESSFDEHDLHLTREELQDAELRGEGKLNWKYFDYLIEKLRKN